MDQAEETVELKAGTLLHYRGMPLELRTDTVVNMQHANKALADEMAEGRVKGCSSASPDIPG